MWSDLDFPVQLIIVVAATVIIGLIIKGLSK